MTLRQFFSIVEIKTKIVSLSTFLISLSYIFLQGKNPSPALIFVLFAAVLMVDMGTTAWNSFFDYFRGTDRQDRESDKVIIHEGVSAGAALIVALGLFATAGIIGIYLVILRGWLLLVPGALSLMVGFFYSGGKYPISHSPLGELFAGGFLGTVLFVIIQLVLVEGEPDFGTWLPLSLPSTLHIAAILTTNNCCDLEADQRAGRRTLSIRIGRRASIVLIAVLVFSAYLLALILNLFAWGGLSPYGAFAHSLALPPAIIIFRNMVRTGFVQHSKGAAMGGISTLFILYSLASLGMIVISHLTI